jgi:alkylation response protein AidB-like acyl-CoA dehydrogenase
MTMTASTPSATADVAGPASAEELVAWAASVGPRLAADAARHDIDGTWVADSFATLRDSGFLAAGVPIELGGLGASVAQLAAAQRELARHCSSTALASAMHVHVTAFNAWRYRNGVAAAETLLRRIATEHIVVVSSGGADFTRPRGTATKVDGGYRVSGRKVFASQSVAGTVMSSMATFDDPERGRRVLNLAVPLGAEGVRIIPTWDAMGMRGTASNDVELDEVFVPDAAVQADRPYGVLDPPLQMVVTIAMPIVAAVYLGVAEGAYRAALAAVQGTPNAGDPLVQRRVGLMAHRLRVASWALDGAHAAVGEAPTPSMENVAAVMAAKREIALAGIEVCDLAMEVGGGAAYFKGSPIERAYRDIRGAKYHPFDNEATLVHAARLALELPCDEW